MEQATVARVRLAECRIPLPRPIRLGPVEITTRDFVVMAVETADGRLGEALGYPRGTPLFDAAALVARRVIGTRASHRRATLGSYLAGAVNGRPAMVRAVSLYDIALGDLAARAAGLPLHHMLGALRDTVPLMAVAGYYLDQRTIDDVADEARALVDAGYDRVKIMLRGDDPDFDRRYVEAVSAAAPGRLAADAHWSWNTVAEAMRTIRAIDDAGLLFLEDPFGAYRNHLLADLQAQMRTPLAAGEDMPDADALAGLADAIPVLRVDATTCGGFTAALAVCEAAGLRGATVLPHVFAPVHGCLAGVSAAVEMCEVIPEQTGADPLGRLLRRLPRIEDGVLHIDQAPGAGVEIDWDAVERHATRTLAIAAED